MIYGMDLPGGYEKWPKELKRRYVKKIRARASRAQKEKPKRRREKKWAAVARETRSGQSNTVATKTFTGKRKRFSAITPPASKQRLTPVPVFRLSLKQRLSVKACLEKHLLFPRLEGAEEEKGRPRVRYL